MTNNAEILTSVAEMQAFRGKIARGFHIRKIPFSQTRAWSLVNGAIGHQSGGFFSVVGAACDRDETSRGV